MGAVETTLATLTTGLPGRVSVEIGHFADNVRYQQCSNWTATLPEGMRPWGKISLNVRCTRGTTASLYVSARVRIDGPYVTTARAIPAGQLITAEDLRLTEGEITAQAPDILLSQQQAIGRTTRSFIAAERPLRLALLRNELTIQSGQEIRVMVKTDHFSVANSGHALDSGATGDSIRVRLLNGKIISGVIRSKGVVEAR